MNELPSQISSQVNKREVDRTGVQEASSIKVAGVYAPQSQGATPPPPTRRPLGWRCGLGCRVCRRQVTRRSGTCGTLT